MQQSPGAVQLASVRVEMGVARVAVTAQYRHRVPGDTGIAAALGDDSTALIVMVDIGLAIAHEEVSLEPAGAGESVVLPVVRYATSTENLHLFDSPSQFF